VKSKVQVVEAPSDASTASPDISKLLIIGSSDSSFSLSQNLQNLANFTRVTHIDNAERAISVLLEDEFGVIVIDHDSSDFETVNLSRTVRQNNFLARIIIISKSYSEELLYELINKGDVDAFLPIPIDDISAYSLILEQQAKHEIGLMLNQLVLRPAKFSPTYSLLHDGSTAHADHEVLQFIGCVVTNESVMRFSYFNENFMNIDEYLFSGYISAIMLLGERLLSNNELLEEINFGGISIFVHNERQLQFLLFFKHLSKSNHRVAETMVKNIVNNIIENSYDLLIDYMPLSNDAYEYIKNIIEVQSTYVDAQSELTSAKSLKHSILLYGKQFPKLNTIMKPFKKVYDITRFNDRVKTMRYLSENDCETVILNPIVSPKLQHFALASQIKDISPRTQIIGLIPELQINDLLNVVNNDSVDFVLTYKDTQVQYYTIIKNAVGRAQKIQRDSTPQRLIYSFDQSTIVKSMLVQQLGDLEKAVPPELYGLFIAKEAQPYYHKFWQLDEDDFELDPVLFAGFISALVEFSSETFDSTNELFTGIKFANASLITRHLYDYTFVFFVRSINQLNLDFTKNHVDVTVGTIHDVLLLHDLEGETNENIALNIDQIGVELFLKLTSMTPP
jgi:PleD family two-component response regulator